MWVIHVISGQQSREIRFTRPTQKLVRLLRIYAKNDAKEEKENVGIFFAKFVTFWQPKKSKTQTKS